MIRKAWSRFAAILAGRRSDSASQDALQDALQDTLDRGAASIKDLAGEAGLVEGGVVVGAVEAQRLLEGVGHGSERSRGSGMRQM